MQKDLDNTIYYLPTHHILGWMFQHPTYTSYSWVDVSTSYLHIIFLGGCFNMGETVEQEELLAVEHYCNDK
jgi:hypothetical protein